MKIIFLIASFATLAALTLAAESPPKMTDKDCHCHKGYVVRGDSEIGYKCHGILSKTIVNCNTIQRPRCACTGATGVLSKESGTWCAEYRSGRETRKWDCENKELWEKFFTQYPDERFPHAAALKPVTILRRENGTSSGVLQIISCVATRTVSSLLKMINYVFLLVFVSAVSADELVDCKCKEGFSPQKDDHGNIYCQGIVLKSILPCNIVFKPDCACGTEATSVVQDSSGTWCGRFIDGKEDRRWECENKSEWEIFYQEHPEERPKQTKS